MSADSSVDAGLVAKSRLPNISLRAFADLGPSAIVGIVFVAIVAGATLLAPFLTDADPAALGGPILQAPSFAHPMGTDDLGRDLFARVLYGGRVSLIVGAFSALIGLGFGMTVGMVAGFFGGAIDESLMRLTEVFQIIPRLLVAIVVVTLLGSSVFNVILVIGFLSWPATARVIRAQVLVLRQEEFMAAAVMSGANWARMILRHALPNVLPYFLVSASLQIASAILSESFLSFLGLGDPTKPSWGLLLQQGQLFLQQAWWLTTFPGLALAMTILGLNLMGDGLGAAFKVLGGRK